MTHEVFHVEKKELKKETKIGAEQAEEAEGHSGHSDKQLPLEGLHISTKFIPCARDIPAPQLKRW